jgi:class 3 adenylate cyclase/tetratricopeptide (TPR) repeat protein
LAAVLKCTACQHQNPNSASDCLQCGAKLRTDDSARHDSGERRYLSVLFCDLIDSSSLAEELGPDDYREVVRIVHESSATIVERHGGQVSQYLGDGILVLFGHPRAHEDDAARAVSAALELQAAIPECTAMVRAVVPTFSGELHTRAAIHTGLVAIGEVGAGAHRPVVALGDTVNIASRLQDLAPSDALLITAATRRLIGERFDCEPRGETQIRGIRAPLDVFRVTGARASVRVHDATRRGELTPMVGREDELARIVGRWERVEAGQGQVVVISGDAGIGKSRLLAAVKRYLSVGPRWFEVRGSLYHQASELRPVLDLLEHRVLEGATGSDARLRLKQQLDDAGLDGEQAVRLLGPLLALPQLPTEQINPLLPDEQRRGIIDALVKWVWRLAADAPIVIALEDLQWFDPTSMELLLTLMANLAGRQVLIITTCRSPFQPAWSAQPNELRLGLDPLTRADAQRLVESIAEQHAPPAAVMRELLEKSDGVPLYLEEVTRMFLDAPAAMATVPDTLRELLAARLDRLPERALETVRLGAVIGRHFAIDLLEAASSRSREHIHEDIVTLLDAGVLLREADGYGFKHVLLRDSAYDRMLRTVRQDLHGTVAATLVRRFSYVAETQPELVAYHFTVAGATTDALREWTRAGARSLRNGAHFEAAHHIEQAIQLIERLPQTTDRNQHELGLRSTLGVSLVATRGYASPAVIDNYARARALSDDLRRERKDIPIPVLYGVWGTYLARGDRDATAELAAHWQLVKRAKDPLARHVAHAALGTRAFYLGRFTPALAHFREAMAGFDADKHGVLLRDYGYEGGLYAHLYAACTLCFVGLPDQGRDLMNQALELSHAIGDPYVHATALALGACVARERRESERTRVLAADLVRLATDHQFVMWLGIGHCLSGWSAVSDGDVKGGAEEIQLGLRIWEATGAQLPGTYLRLMLIEAYLAMREVDAALALLDRGLEQCRTTVESYQKPEYYRLKGEMLGVKRDVRGARREILRALKSARGQGATWIELRAALSLARLADAGEGRASADVDAHDVLADVMSRLPEGVGTQEFGQANALLETRV